jgi:predicted amidophosphoribosyltransferase
VIAYANAFLDLLWPPVCPRCGARAERARDHFCAACWAALRPSVDEARERPALDPLREADGIVVACAFSVDALFLDILATSKYRRFRGVGLRLAREAARRLDGRIPPGALVPVPLTAAKLRERGFNQTEDFARALQSLVSAPSGSSGSYALECRWLRRRRGGRALAGRSADDRAQAVSGAFSATSDVAGGPPVTLVDDVLTTGATLRECTRAIRDAGGAVAAWVAMGRAGGTNDVAPTTRDALAQL